MVQLKNGDKANRKQFTKEPEDKKAMCEALPKNLS